MSDTVAVNAPWENVDQDASCLKMAELLSNTNNAYYQSFFLQRFVTPEKINIHMTSI